MQEWLRKFQGPVQNANAGPLATAISQARKRNKRNPNWKGRSKTVTVCRWHGTIYRKSQRYYQKTIRTLQ